jgi:hypothetical protein
LLALRLLGVPEADALRAIEAARRITHDELVKPRKKQGGLSLVELVGDKMTRLFPEALLVASVTGAMAAAAAPRPPPSSPDRDEADKAAAAAEERAVLTGQDSGAHGGGGDGGAGGDRGTDEAAAQPVDITTACEDGDSGRVTDGESESVALGASAPAASTAAE